MNSTIADFTRQSIKEGLQKLPDRWVYIFKRMYSHNNLDADIDTVVDNMVEDKLDWALIQVKNSITKLKGDD